MAEFVEVMKQYHRMCKSMKCSDCELNIMNNGAGMACYHFIIDHPDEAEIIITAWAKANPETKSPKYPNWYEYLGAYGTKPIPEAIAKQLGLEPIK